MKKILLSTLLIAAFATTTHAIPIKTSTDGLPERDGPSRQDICYLAYYNIGSGWVYHWAGWGGYHWCQEEDYYAFGTCFDLTDCEPECRDLTDVWVGLWGIQGYGLFDLEIYCADAVCCPLGPPLAGFYAMTCNNLGFGWYHFVFGPAGGPGLVLCPCDEPAQQFIAMVTAYCGLCWPVSDIGQSAPGVWRCDGTHSYVYSHVINYCAVYGVPSPLWSNYGGCPVGTAPWGPPAGYFTDPGAYCEWIIDCYITCLGPTASEETTWSQIKDLYR
jgi:hypothetical protein